MKCYAKYHSKECKLTTINKEIETNSKVIDSTFYVYNSISDEERKELLKRRLSYLLNKQSALFSIKCPIENQCESMTYNRFNIKSFMFTFNISLYVLYSIIIYGAIIGYFSNWCLIINIPGMILNIYFSCRDYKRKLKLDKDIVRVIAEEL